MYTRNKIPIKNFIKTWIALTTTTTTFLSIRSIEKSLNSPFSVSTTSNNNHILYRVSKSTQRHSNSIFVCFFIVPLRFYFISCSHECGRRKSNGKNSRWFSNVSKFLFVYCFFCMYLSNKFTIYLFFFVWKCFVKPWIHFWLMIFSVFMHHLIYAVIWSTVIGWFYEMLTRAKSFGKKTKTCHHWVPNIKPKYQQKS